MVRAGLVVSTRGAAGGYALARPARDISAAQIIDALEGPVAITECSSASGTCSLESICGVGVITSYSIHYTKLYDPLLHGAFFILSPDPAYPCRPPPPFSVAAPADVAGPGVRFQECHRGVGVITSYSIHYTKLYDSLKAPARSPTSSVVPTVARTQ